MLGIAEIIKKPVLIGIVFLIVVCAGSVSAQKNAKPDFTGTWVLDEDKSFDLLKKLSGKPAPDPDPRKRTTTLIISHSEPRFEATEKQTFEELDNVGNLTGKTETLLFTILLFTDKRGEINTFQPNERNSSVTTWDGKKIFTVITLDKDKGRGGIVTFELLENGRELHVKLMETTRAGINLGAARNGIKVYRKVD